MHRKNNPIATALNTLSERKKDVFNQKWRVFSQLNDNLYIMVSKKNGKSVYMPLYIHSFKLDRAYTYAETIKFREQCEKPHELTEIVDKLRFYRHKLGLYQKDVAEYLSITQGLYKEYETAGNIQQYPIWVLEKLAILFDVDLMYLLDDYNLFLYRGQEQQIKEARLKTGLTRSAFADKLNIHRDVMNNWENGKKRITKKSYERIRHLFDYE